MTPGEILDFVLSLRQPASGFNIGLPQYASVHDLLLALIRRGEFPSHPSALKTLLAPLICTNADQQTEFYALFDHRFQAGGAHPVTKLAIANPEAPQASRWRRPYLATVALLVAVGIWWSMTRDPSAPPVPAAADQPATTATVGEAPTGPATLVDVQGSVRDERGNPVADAEILYPPNRVVATDANGQFIASLPKGFATRFLVSRVDYRPQLKEYQGAGNLVVSLVRAAGAAGSFEIAPVQGGPFGTREAALEATRGVLPAGSRLTRGKSEDGPEVWYLLSTTSVLGAGDVEAARPSIDENNMPAVAIVFTPDGGERLGAYTAAHIGEQLAWIVNDQVVIAPIIEGRFTTEARISGSFTAGEVSALVESITGHLTPAPVRQTDWRARIHPHLATIRLVATVLPLVGVSAFWLWVWRRRLALRKWRTPLPLGTRKLEAVTAMDAVFPALAIRGLAQEMRRRTPRLSTELAAAATVHATVGQAGYFTPIFAIQRVAPEYLVLVERTGARDQHAQLMAELLARLSAAEVLIHVYYYSGDPRASVAAVNDGAYGDESTIHSLEELAALHAGHRLWLIGSADGLMDPISRKMHTWASTFSQWDIKAIFNTGSSEGPERVLRSEGFHLASASLNTMRAAIDETLEDGHRIAAADPSDGFPALFHDLLPRWFSIEEPAPADVTTMLAATRRFLGARAYDCFCACAVYPQLSLQITMEMARTLLADGERYESIERIVRLPWMRYGVIPDWLRRRLLRRLQPSLIIAATQALSRLLDRVREGGVRKGWLEFVRRTPDQRGLSEPDRDYVFLSILWGRRPDALAFRPPKRLARMFFTNGDIVFGTRPLVHTVVAAVLSLMLWFGTTTAEAYLQPAAETPSIFAMDPFTRRVLEIAESQSGTTSSSGLWSRPFIDWCFDEAAKLFGQANPLLAPTGNPTGVVYASQAFFGGVTNDSIVAWSDSIADRSDTIVHIQTPAVAKFADYRLPSQPKREIAIVVESARIPFSEVQQFAAVAQKQVDRDLSQHWPVRANIKAYARLQDVGPDASRVIFRDAAGPLSTEALANSPFAIVEADGSWTLSASQTLLKLLVDPFGARVVRGPALFGPTREVSHRVEVTNPVNRQGAYVVDGMTVANFVLPRWYYDPAPMPGAAYDFTGALSGPRQLAAGGSTRFGDPATGRWAMARNSGDGISTTDLGDYSVDGLVLTAPVPTVEMQMQKGERSIRGPGAQRVGEGYDGVVGSLTVTARRLPPGTTLMREYLFMVDTGDRDGGGPIMDSATTGTGDAGARAEFPMGVRGVRFWLEGPGAKQYSVTYNLSLTSGSMALGRDGERAGDWTPLRSSTQHQLVWLSVRIAHR
jgi:hypothetical protein